MIPLNTQSRKRIHKEVIKTNGKISLEVSLVTQNCYAKLRKMYKLNRRCTFTNLPLESFDSPVISSKE